MPAQFPWNSNKVPQNKRAGTLPGSLTSFEGDTAPNSFAVTCLEVAKSNLEVSVKTSYQTNTMDILVGPQQHEEFVPQERTRPTPPRRGWWNSSSGFQGSRQWTARKLT